MKSLLLIASLLTFSLTSAQAQVANLGAPMGLATIQQQPALGVIYSLAADPDGLNFLLDYRTILNDNQIQTLQPDLRWNIYLKSTQTYLFPWSDDHLTPKTSLIVGQFNISDPKVIKSLLINLGSAVLVFANDVSNTPVYHLSLGDWCENNPELFQDIDDPGAAQCNKITAEQVIPPSPATQLKKLERTKRDYSLAARHSAW